MQDENFCQEGTQCLRVLKGYLKVLYVCLKDTAEDLKDTLNIINIVKPKFALLRSLI